MQPLRISVSEATHIAVAHFGLSGTATVLQGEYDANFRFVSDSGVTSVLKVMHPSRDQGLIDLQIAALEYVAGRDPALTLPRVHRSVSGRSRVEVILDDGRRAIVWMLSWIAGTPLALVQPRHGPVATDVGRVVGRFTVGMSGFAHPAADRDFKWDLTRAVWIAGELQRIAESAKREIVEQVIAEYRSTVLPLLPALRRSVIHGDVNDFNVVVDTPRATMPEVAGVIDFGDMHRSATVCEPAIAAAYALLGASDPLAVAARVVGGFHGACPLTETELQVMFPLICMRLAVSVVNSAGLAERAVDDAYATVSEGPAWDALAQLRAVPPALAYYTFRAACGLEPVPQSENIVRWLAQHADSAASVLSLPVRHATQVVFDLSVGSREFGADPAHLEPDAMGRVVDDVMRRTGATIGVGRYDEPRAVYMVPAFALGPLPTDERRTVHMGIDLFADAGTGVCAPIAGTVHAFANNAAPQDYGPVIILRHETGDGVEFFSLYGHLSVASLATLNIGDVIAGGQQFATLGAVTENGGWAPHLHFQLMTDMLGLGTEFPGVVPASMRDVWRRLSPDPGALLGVSGANAGLDASTPELLAQRKEGIGGNVRLSYQSPLTMVRGWRQYLYDDTGRAFLDVYNNVPLVGHSHPHVVRAVQQQMALLNTNTRYLHENLIHYASRLTAHLPSSLSVCYIVNSGSEANELALRLARAHTQRHDIAVLEHAYHGHTSTLIDISPYKFNGPGGQGQKSWVHVAPIADDYRGAFRRDDPDRGMKYAAAVADVTRTADARGDGLAAFIHESAPSVAGQIMLPPHYLEHAYRHVRASGGLCIADEVQTGFGRLGSHFWGFEMQQVTPDIVVMGKPIGNGFPLAAVVTTPAIAASFDNGMEFFSTFGGNPVACAAGIAVLDVVRDEHLQQNALRVGHELAGHLTALADRHALIGDVRGSGLFLGVELVRDRHTLEPATTEASYVVNRLRECGVLCGTDGPHHNVLKIRPPLCFSAADAELFAGTLDQLLREDAIRATNP